MFTPRTLTLAELTFIAATCFIGLTIFDGLLLDFLDFPIDPGIVFVAALVELALIGQFLLRRGVILITPVFGELFGFLIVVGAVSAYMIYPSLPGGLAPSHHFDAVNHVLLADFIFDHNALARDMTGSTNPYFMNWYPAGGALFAAVVSHWFGSEPIRTLHPVASLFLGLSAGVVFILINRLRPDKPSTKPVALMATALLFTAWNYFPGLVNERYVYAQVVSQFFAIAVFFFAYLYWVKPDLYSLLSASFATGIVSVSHPTALVAAFAAASGAILLHPGIDRAKKIVHECVFVVGLLPIASVYLVQHIQYWTRLAGYGEAVPLTLDTIGLALPLLSLLGIGSVIRSRMKHEQLFPLLLVLAVLTQPLVLLAVRPFIQGVDTQFFERSIYLLIYPLAMLSAIPVLEFAEGIRIHLPDRDFRIVEWAGALAAAAAILVLFPPQPFAPLTLPELASANWAKQNLDTNDVAIVSSIREDAYWIELAVFGSGMATPATTSAYEIGPMDYAEWRGNPGPPDYAIVRNTTRVSIDPAVTVLYQTGESAVLQKERVMPAAAPTLDHATALRFDDMFDLVGYDLAQSGVLSVPLTATFYWRPLRWPSARVAMFIQVLDSRGQVVTRQEGEMLQKRFPTQRWPIGSVLTDTWSLTLPVDAGAGDYELEVVVFDQYSGNRFGVSGADARSKDQIKLGPIHLSIPPPSDVELSTAHPINTLFGNGIALLSYSSEIRSVDTESVLDVTLYWTTAAPIPVDYTVFVHLLDPSGQLIAQVDLPPQNGTWPTSSWLPGRIVRDPYHLVIPKNSTPGEYRVEVGLYTPLDLNRLPVAGTDHITLPQTFALK